jgi:hypothetical protein
VIIQSTGDEEEKLSFINHEFNEQIKSIRKKVEELKSIDISFETSKEQPVRRVNSDLYSYLKLRQEKLRRGKSKHQQKLFIKCQRSESSSGNESVLDETIGSEVERIFNIKTM